MNKAELQTAVEAALRGEWDKAHNIVQQFDDEMACWIHAVLHKMEGHSSNSLYWYRKAGKSSGQSADAPAELHEIQAFLSK